MGDGVRKIAVKYLPGINYLKIEKEPGDTFYYSNDTEITISIYNLVRLLNFLVKRGFLSHKILEGILEEYHSTK